MITASPAQLVPPPDMLPATAAGLTVMVATVEFAEEQGLLESTAR
jgi:hypothetical protein